MELTVQGEAIFANTGGQPFDASKPVIVLVHGAGMDHSIWGQQARFLAHRGFSVLSVDLPGHGRSGGAARSSIKDTGDFLAELIGAAGVSGAILVGHSMGALACLRAAADHPDAVSGLVLCGAAAEMPVHPDLLAAARADNPVAAQFITAFGVGSRAQRGGNAAHGVWLTGLAQRLLEGAPAGVLGVDLAACDADKDVLENAGRVQCPTLLLLAEKDKMTPVKAALPLKGALKNAEVRILANCGHMMMVEAPGDTRAALLDFARSTSG